MITFIRQIMNLPEFEDPNQARIIGLLGVSLWIVLFAALALPLILIFFDSSVESSSDYLFHFFPTLLLLIAIAWIRWLIHKHRIQMAIFFLSLIFLIAITVAVLNSGLGMQSPSISGYVIVIILAGTLAEGRNSVIIFTLLSLLATFGLYLAQQLGVLALSADPILPGISFIVYIFVFVLVGSLLSIAFRRLNTALNRAQTSEQSYRELADVLELRVAERTKALERGAEVSRRLSTILEQEQLAAEVVDEVQKTFDYYHVHVFFLDEKKQNLVLAGGTGEMGRILLANGHKLTVRQGIVGQAFRERETILVPDVHQHPAWMANALLEETVAEIAVPIILGDRILGVLDVQHNMPNRLNENDKIWLELIAGQVAAALENARLFKEAQQRGERESLINEIGYKIQQAETVDEILQIAAQELGQALNSQRTRIQVGRIEL